MTFANELYRQDDKCFRILWTDERNDLIAWIAIEDDKGMPELISFAALFSLIAEGVVTRSDSDPYSTWPLESSLSEAQKKKRDDNWRMIESLVRSEPGIFFPGQRSKLLRERCDDTGAVWWRVAI